MILNVYLVEDDVDACDRFKKSAEYMDDILIEGHTDNSNEAYNHIVEHNPDAIVLDLELNIGNGPELLEKINKLSDNQRPFVMVTTNNSNPIMLEHLHQNNTGYIFQKFKPDYSEYSVLNFLRMFKTSIYNYRNHSYNAQNIDKADVEASILNDIDLELAKIGIPEKVKGYPYIKSGIFYVLKNSYDNNMIKELATMYDCKPQAIEHNMRYAITSAWARYKSINELKKVYTGHISNDMNPPSIGVFVSHYAEMLKNKHNAHLDKLN